MAERLAGRIALVTGASRGIGAAVSRRFAEEGAHVILTARTVGGLEAVHTEIKALGGSATLVPLDLRKFDEIDRMGGALYERFGKLDILVANAGVFGVLSSVDRLDPAVWQEAIDVNLTASFRLIRSLDPLLRASESGRAIFVTTGGAIRGRASWAAYAASKAGLDALVRCYADEMENTSVRVNLLNPRGTRTRLRAEAYPGEDPNTIKTAESITGLFVELAEVGCTRHGETIQAG
jgi:NAD(P)-dependent dehydrogenase (short-subunit alcohol dehydrogenase family)